MNTVFRLLFPVWIGLCASASAEAIRDYYAEPGINPFKDSINQNFNEHIDPFSGSVSLGYVDLRIPGNGGLDIEINRVYNSVQDNVGNRNVNGVGWTMHFGRIVVPSGDADKICAQNIWNVAVTNNPSLEKADGGREILFLSNDPDAYLVTRSRWKAECGISGLIVTAPDGTVYTMDQYEANGNEISWYASRIEDANGNRIDIAYKTGGGFTYIDRVTASDGRLVQFNYDFDGTSAVRLGSITANAQTWVYKYGAIPELSGGQEQLVEVVRPDNKRWKYAYYDHLGTPGVAGSFSLKQVIYPYGGTIDYAYKYVYFDPVDTSHPTAVLDQKVIGGSGISPGTWTYSYEPAIDRGSALDKTTVTAPNGRYEYQHFGYSGNFSGSMWKVGLMISRELYDPEGLLVEQEINDWGSQVISDENYWHGRSVSKLDTNTVAPILLSREIWRQGGLYVTTYLNHDSYGNPQRVVETGNVIGDDTRITDYTYYTDSTRWILGLIKDETITGIGTISRTFDTSGNLLTEDKYGVLTTYTYYPSGDVNSVTDARNKAIVYQDYFRGIARQENRPESVTILRVVNPTGTLAAETDGRGNTTGFSYDGLNRLSGIDFPANADVGITWTPNSKVLTRGDYREEAVLDGFSRSVQIVRQDTVLSDSITTTTQYDALGNKVFESYPNSVQGTTFTYDVLGRVTRTEHPDGTFRTVAYVDPAGSGVERETNERGFVTKRLYRAFGHPDDRDLVRIDSPENVQTLIDRNLIGQITRVWQGEAGASGYQRDYSYDARYFLVSRNDPEIGATVFGRDAVGNMISKKVGVLPQTDYIYDDLNRLTNIDYPVGTPDVIYSYDENDNVIRVDNGVGERIYTYDLNDNLESEILNVDTVSLAMHYAYSPLDFVDSITYPSSRLIGYAPDAFGRPRTVGAFVTSVDYHATGVPSSITLANGARTDIALHPTRFWPAGTLTLDGASTLVNLDYGYDSVGNVSTITDLVSTANNKVLGYDGLDRLNTADGPWGSGSISYDHRGNITQKSIGGTNIVYSYSSNRLIETIRNGQSDGAIVYDGYGNVAFSGNPFSVARPLREYTYDDANNMVEAKVNSNVIRQFSYDGSDTLIKETVAGSPTYKLYSKSGDLIGEYDASGALKKEYAYLGGKMVAAVEVLPPLAEAGPDQAVFAGTNVTLNASNSSAYDDAITTYSWVQTSGPAVSLNNPMGATPDFLAPSVSGGVELIFQLTVTDSRGATAVDTVTVTSWEAVAPPAADNHRFTQGDGEIALSWDTLPQATSYNIYWSTAPGVTPQMGNAINDVQPGFVHTGITNGQALYYIVTAVNQYGESIASSEFRAVAGVNGWSKAYELSTADHDVAGSGRIYGPEVVSDASGRSLVAWVQRVDGRYRLYARNYNPQAGWSETQNISGDIYGAPKTPVLAMDQDTGRAIAIIENTQLYAILYDPTVGWLPPQEITGIPFNSGTTTELPRASINSAGVAVVTWMQADPFWNATASIYDPATSTWATPVTLGANGSLTKSVVGIDSSSNALALWSFGDSLRVSRYDASVQSWSTPDVLPFWAKNISGQTLSLAFNAADDAIVTWRDNSFNLQSNRYQAGVGWLGIEPVVSTGDIGYADVTLADDGSAIAIWSTFNPPFHGYAAQRSASGWGAPVLLESNMSEPVISGRGGGDALALWSGMRGARFTPGVGWAYVYPVGNGFPGDTGAVAIDGTGNGVAAWASPGVDGKDRLVVNHYQWLGTGFPGDKAPPQAVVSTLPTSALAEGQSVDLDGSASSDQDGTVVSYSWMQVSGTPAVVMNASTATPTVVLPNVPQDETLVFELKVTDNDGLTHSETGSLNVFNMMPTNGGFSAFAGDSLVDLSWAPAYNAISYNLYWSNSPGVTTTNGTRLENVVSPYQHTGLMNDSTYHYVLTSVNAFGVESEISNEVSATPTFLPWSGVTQVSSAGASSPQYPQVAINDAGDGIAVWEQGEEIWSSRYAAGSGFLTPERANILPAGAVDWGARNVQVAVNVNGDAFAIWEQRTDNDIYYSTWGARYTVSGGWETAQVLESDDTSNAIYQQIAMNDMGDAIAVWRQSDTNGDASIFANRYLTGSGWLGAENIDNITAPASHSSLKPQAGINNAGEIIVVWPSRDSTRYDMWARRYIPGTGWGSAVRIDALDGPVNNPHDAYDPALAMHPDGTTAVAAWRQWDGIAFSIFVAHYIPGLGWQPAQLLETLADDTYAYGEDHDRPVYIDMNSSGEVAVSWHQAQGVWASVTYHQYVSRYIPSPGVWTTPEIVSDQTQGTVRSVYSRHNGRVVINDSGRIAAIWPQRWNQDNSNRIFANYYIPGSGWSGLQMISAQGVSRSGMDLAIDANGNAVAVMADYLDGVWSSDVAGGSFAVPDTPPVAHAGSDQMVSEADAVTLDASASSDADGPLSYAWVQTSGSPIALSGSDTASAGFIAPQVTGATVLGFTLTVTDTAGATDTDTVDVTVQLLDTDSDGLSDLWEQGHFGTTTVLDTGDADGDGISNLDEFLQQQDPLDGDVNGDGALSLVDILLLQRHVMGISQMTSAQQQKADLAPWGNPDGALNPGDLAVMYRRVAAAR